MNEKVYARQIPPEYQESPVFDVWPEDVIVTGNRDYTERTTNAFDTIVNNIDNIADDIDDITRARQGWYSTVTEYFNDMFPPEHKEKYDNIDIYHWKKIAERYYKSKSDEEPEIICAALCLMTGKRYAYATIRGCSQSEWVRCYYPAGWWACSLHTFEVEYFNTGSEWIIHDEDFEPERAEDITGSTLYCTTSDPRAEIADAYDTVLENVVLYAFDGYTQLAKYTKL